MILLVDLSYREDSLSTSEFVSPIVHIVESCRREVEIRHFTRVIPEMVSSAEAVILCGTALRDNLFTEHTGEFWWLRECNAPVLGICAGMQVIARVFLGSLRPLTEIGMNEVRVVYQGGLFAGKTTFPAYELHSYACDPPQDFDVLAESEACVQAFKHRTKELYGVLFHPEVRNEWVVERFLTRVPLAGR